MTTAFRNPATPAIGDTACVGATTAAPDCVVFVVLVDRAELAEKVCGASALAAVVAVGAVATICTASTDATGAAGATTGDDGDEFASAAVIVGRSTTGAGLADGALVEPLVVSIGSGGSDASAGADGSSASGVAASGEFDSDVLVCAPPLLLTATPGATCSVDDVVPVGVPVTSVPAFTEPPPAEADSGPSVFAAGVAASDSADEASEDAVLDEAADDSDDVPVVSAAAHP
ncbi:hypothetical protein [Mycolicibacterium arenosum]|uniref:Uncharacterized protein n=1 Tax=Mycolicibacterium arenosum TaxID=2952157 RepID=A0ABT1M5W8_9MYCO|nr:hypothetical protein [Mycolicibacterium sp. CAU 1645]MCP9273629.1 hypothetical protein [Mycolicibacterium sp. CAU 1645]